jgi:hypothetical protein
MYGREIPPYMVIIYTALATLFNFPNFSSGQDKYFHGPASAGEPMVGNHLFMSLSVSKDDGQICCGRFSIFIGLPHVISGYGVGIQIFTGVGVYNSKLMILQTSGFTAFCFCFPSLSDNAVR